MKRLRIVRATSAALFFFGCVISVSALDREKAIESFEIHPDFQIELVAAEPTIFDPVDLAFDELGRAFVIEMPGYPLAGKAGNVILLGDEDGDGYYESRTVFAGGFSVADSVLPYKGGILVASPPDLVFVKDTDGDGTADERRVLLTGFAVDNPQHNFSGLTHGLDNWIYAANGGNGGSPYWPGRSNERVQLRFNDFRIDLREQKFEPVGRSAGGFELTSDAWGRFYGTHNLHHIRMSAFSGRYLEHLGSASSSTLADISDHEENGMARIFPLGVQDTRVNHPEQSGYFSGACGITYYGGGAFPEEFDGHIFVADVVLNLIHEDILEADGTVMSASRGGERMEFLASRDRGFRPVNMTVGPDGALYVLDMHREVIEHPEWIPDELEEKMDLDAGKDQGRIYRITPKNGRSFDVVTFETRDPDALVAALAHPNKWTRDTAQRLLLEIDAKEAIKPLRAMLRDAPEALGRLHALWTLEGLNALESDDVLTALNDDNAGVRENALVVAEQWPRRRNEIQERVLAMAEDENARVRMQAALSIGTGGDALSEEAVAALLTIARRDVDDEWTRLAVSSALAKSPLSSLHAVLGEPEIVERAEGQALAQTLAKLTGERETEKVIVALVDRLSTDSPVDAAGTARVLQGLAAGVKSKTRTKLSAAETEQLTRAVEGLLSIDDPKVLRAAWSVASAFRLRQTPRQYELLRVSKAFVLDSEADLDRRLAYLSLYERELFSIREPVLFALLDTAQPRELQRAAIDQLGDAREISVAQKLIERWGSLGPDIIGPAGDILLYQRANHDLLLTAIENGDLAIGQLNLDLERRRTLLRSRDDSIRARAEALFTDAGVVTRREAIERMRPALELDGDAEKGHEVFSELCVQCHRLGAEGNELGPNLTDIFRKSPETLLHDILDPNAALDTQFVSYAIETHAGDFVNGIVVDESEDTITLRGALGEETVFEKSDIEEMYTDGLSMMPEELEVDLEPQTMADLLAFLLKPR